jgi:phosphohistidine phosphatase
MRSLLLMRHAKSSWDQPGLADLDRPLAPRGRQAAPLVARHLRDQGLVPDLVLCSPALRVQETWQLMAPALGGSVASKTLRSLYPGAPSRLLEALRRLPDDIGRALLIGHNPGLAACAVALAGAGPSKGLQRMRAKFGTASVAVLSFEIGHWSALAAGGGRLESFVRPKDLT